MASLKEIKIDTSLLPLCVVLSRIYSPNFTEQGIMSSQYMGIVPKFGGQGVRVDTHLLEDPSKLSGVTSVLWSKYSKDFIERMLRPQESKRSLPSELGGKLDFVDGKVIVSLLPAEGPKIRLCNGVEVTNLIVRTTTRTEEQIRLNLELASRKRIQAESLPLSEAEIMRQWSGYGEGHTDYDPLLLNPVGKIVNREMLGGIAVPFAKAIEAIKTGGSNWVDMMPKLADGCWKYAGHVAELSGNGKNPKIREGLFWVLSVWSDAVLLYNDSRSRNKSGIATRNRYQF